MKLQYIVSVLDLCEKPQSQHKYKTLSEARAKYARIITTAEQYNIGSVVLIDASSTGSFGRGISWVTVAAWQRPNLVEKIERAYGYKIHGFDTVIDPSISASTAKWYKTEAAAIKAAKQMAQRCYGRTDALVIYKAVMVVEQDGVTYV